MQKPGIYRHLQSECRLSGRFPAWPGICRGRGGMATEHMQDPELHPEMGLLLYQEIQVTENKKNHVL